MRLSAIYAHLNCSNLEASAAWFETLFDRAPDAAPMEGLLEWLHAESAGLQLFRSPRNAGTGTLTLIVADVHAEHGRLLAMGLQPGAVEAGDHVLICRMRDPDGNLVVLAQANHGDAIEPFEATDT